MLNRTQKGLRATPPSTTPLSHLEIGIAEIIPSIEFVDLGNSVLLSGVPPCIKNFPTDALLFDTHLSTNTVKIISTVLVIF